MSTVEEAKKEGLMIVDFEHTAVRVLEGTGPLDKDIIKAFFARIAEESKEGQGDEINKLLFEVRWDTEGDLIGEAHDFLQKITVTNFISFASNITDQWAWGDRKELADESSMGTSGN